MGQHSSELHFSICKVGITLLFMGLQGCREVVCYPAECWLSCGDHVCSQPAANTRPSPLAETTREVTSPKFIKLW